MLIACIRRGALENPFENEREAESRLISLFEIDECHSPCDQSEHGRYGARKKVRVVFEEVDAPKDSLGESLVWMPKATADKRSSKC